MVTYSRYFGRIRNRILGAIAVLILLGFLVQSVVGTAYYSMVMQAYGTVGSPPVILEEGNCSGTSTIYTNKTSAKVSVAAPVWLSGWDKRVKITIDSNDVDSALSNFPVLVYLSSSSGHNNDNVTFVFDEVGSNSKKIAVTTSDGATECYVEIDKWDDASEQAWLWVKVPSISNTTDTDLYLYYDSDHANNTDYVGDTNSEVAENVWDSDFKFVGHMRDDPDTSHVRDSTSNNNDGNKTGANQPAVTTGGQIDDAQDFSGGDYEIDFGNPASLQMSGDITVEAWCWGHKDVYAGMFGKLNTGSDDGWALCKLDTDVFRFWAAKDNSYVSVDSDSAYDETNMHYVVGVVRGTEIYIYVDGVEQTDSPTADWEDSGSDCRIGRQYDDFNDRWWEGGIDEVRASDKDRGADWIKASYESGRDDLLDFGSEEKKIDFVDNNTSNEGSPTDRGTHSDFSAQQAGPDSIYDTLTEENTGGASNTTLIDAESFENLPFPPTGWSDGGSAWNRESDYAYDGTFSADYDGPAFGSSSGDLDSPSLDCSDANAIYVSFYFREDVSLDNEFQLLFWNGATWVGIEDLGLGYSPGWNPWEMKVTDSQYFKPDFGIRWRANSVDSGEHAYVDLVTVKKEVQTYEYELDLEVQWTNADYDETNEELAIYVDEGNNTHSLDATGGYMIIGGNPDWGSTTGTISFWIKMDTNVQGRFWGQDGNMETRFSGGTYLILDWGADNSMTSAYSFSADTWYFVAIVWDENNDNLFLYIGDENNPPTLDANSLSGTWTSTTPGPTENRFMNGLGASEPVDGHGDELRYWDTDRTLAEIQSDYNTELTGSETNLRSYFKLNNNFDDVGPDDNDGSGSGSYSFSPDVPFLNGTPTENIRVDVWYSGSWQNLFTNLTNGWNNVSVSSYLTSSNFTIRFNGGNENNDTTQDSWYIDATLLHVWTPATYDYVLKVVNQVADNWTINLQVYDSSNIGRLSSLNISFHDGTSSNQIAVSGGNITKSEGEPYNLPEGLGSTIYISMSNLQATTTGTSYLYVHLKIQVPSTSVYMLYVITFKIT